MNGDSEEDKHGKRDTCTLDLCNPACDAGIRVQVVCSSAANVMDRYWHLTGNGTKSDFCPVTLNGIEFMKHRKQEELIN